MQSQELTAFARHLRLHVLNMVSQAKSSHIGGNYSIAELIAVLYGNILRIDPSDPHWKDRDRFILSKGHACAILYAALAEKGFFSPDWLDTFYQNGSLLIGHVSHHVPGVEISTGSLGHGLPIGVGMALDGKRSRAPYRVFVLMSDGECDAGTVWEAALFAHHHHLDNLTVIVDYNKIQSLDSVQKTLDLEPFVEKWRAFGWQVHEIDGHDIEEIQAALLHLPIVSGFPSCIVAHTIKGKGVSFMENEVLWHYRSPQGEEFEAALQELQSI